MGSLTALLVASMADWLWIMYMHGVKFWNYVG
jgi:hypothetical protein